MHTAKYIAKMPSLKGKTYIITGANSGLGFALASLLLEKEAHVIMANRNKERSMRAHAKLLEMWPNAILSEYYYDQADTASILAFVQALKDHEVHFDGIVFNAGIYLPARGLKTSNNMARTFGVNYYGNYVLTKALSEKGLINKKTRLVYTTSLAAYKTLDGKMLDRLISGEDITRHRQYKGAKAALDTFALGLMLKSNIIPFAVPGKVYLYHPGVSDTNITRFKFKPFNILVHTFMRIVFHTPKKAVLGALLALTTSEDLNGKKIVPSGPFETRGVPKTEKIDERILAHLPLLITKTENYIKD